VTAARSVAGVREHPILFSAPMVKAILAGTKTQTRRIVRLDGVVEPGDEDNAHVELHDGAWKAWDTEYEDEGHTVLRCPFGVPGDHLWVRESFCPNYFDDRQPGTGNKHGYRADWDPDAMRGIAPEPRWTPSIHMPRAASRITLEVTEVRVERLQAITEEDAKAEGVQPLGPSISADQPLAGERLGRTHGTHPHTLAFAVLWDTINDARAPWRSNPFVWCVSFRRVTP
jgi:hypothetical protein